MMKKRMGELSLMNLAEHSRDRAALGSTLVVFDSTKDEEIVYKLVTSEESDVTKGMVSTTSPIGRAPHGKKLGRCDHGRHSRRHARAGDFEAQHHARQWRRRNGIAGMTWTSAVGKYCGVLLYKIVDGLALTRISPNMLTFVGLVINVVAALFFGFASADNNQPRRFIYAGWSLLEPASLIWWTGG